MMTGKAVLILFSEQWQVLGFCFSFYLAFKGKPANKAAAPVTALSCSKYMHDWDQLISFLLGSCVPCFEMSKDICPGVYPCQLMHWPSVMT